MCYLRKILFLAAVLFVVLLPMSDCKCVGHCPPRAREFKTTDHSLLLAMTTVCLPSFYSPVKSHLKTILKVGPLRYQEHVLSHRFS